MKYVFCSMMYTDPTGNINQNKAPKSISGHKFQYNLSKGLIENGVDLKILNTERISTFPNNRKLMVKNSPFAIDGKTVGKNIKYLNLPIVSFITQYISLYKSLNNYLKKYPTEKIVLFVFNTHFVQSKVVLTLKKKYEQIITCNVVGDLYGKYGISVVGKGIKNQIRRKLEKKQELMQNRFDKYVLLASLMADALNVSSEDFVLVEGFYDGTSNDGNTEKINVEEPQALKIIFYAGSLQLVYGIEHLLKSFEMIKMDNYRLYIAGIGDGEKIVKKYAQLDKRIIPLGFMTPDEVKKYQQSATVLISPRKSDELFTRYSFPSKTFECLASGKPYIAHKLLSEPSEYSKYIQYPDDESDEALYEKIVQICEMSEADRNAIAQKAKHFITEEKNIKVMCKKVVSYFENV